MISEIKTLGDLLIRLFSERQSTQARVVSEIIDPMFDATKAIITEYRKIMATALENAESKDRHKVGECLPELKMIRATYLAEREALAAMATSVLKHSGDDEHKRFAALVYEIFFGKMWLGSDGPLYPLGGTGGISSIRALEDYIEGKTSYVQLISSIERMSRALDQNWRSLSEAFARIKTKAR